MFPSAEIIGHDDIYEELQEHDVATDKRLTSIEHLLQKTGQGKILNELEEHDKIADKKLSNIEHLLQKLLGLTPAQSKVSICSQNSETPVISLFPCSTFYHSKSFKLTKSKSCLYLLLYE